MRSIVLAGDIGGVRRYHVGDEAMFTANVDWLKERFPSVRVVAVSDDPHFTAATHGLPCLREPRPTRSHELAGRLSRRRRPIAGGMLPREWRAVGDALADADLLLMSGGGNLTSLYSDQVGVRSALALLALAHRVPVAVVGQMLGPSLSPTDRALLSAWLPRAVYVGVRDARSAGLARELGVDPRRVALAPDEALMLEERRPRPPRLLEFLRRDRTRPLIAVSVHRHRAVAGGSDARLASSLAPWLDRLARRRGAALFFIPHSISSVPAAGDAGLALALRRRLSDPQRSFVATEALIDREVKYLTARCDAVVASRYHAVVFGLGVGVPCLGIAQDTYTRTKLEGAFAGIGAAADPHRSLAAERDRLHGVIDRLLRTGDGVAP